MYSNSRNRPAANEGGANCLAAHPHTVRGARGSKPPVRHVPPPLLPPSAILEPGLPMTGLSVIVVQFPVLLRAEHDRCSAFLTGAVETRELSELFRCCYRPPTMQASGQSHHPGGYSSLLIVPPFLSGADFIFA